MGRGWQRGGGKLLHAFLKQKSIAVAYFGLTYLYN